jgi:hypothetical protein
MACDNAELVSSRKVKDFLNLHLPVGGRLLTSPCAELSNQMGGVKRPLAGSRFNLLRACSGGSRPRECQKITCR